MSKTNHSLWNIKDIIILQFVAVFLGYLTFHGQNLLIAETHPLAPLFYIILFFMREILLLAILIYWYFFLYELPGDYFGLTFFHFRKSLLPAMKVVLPILGLIILFIHFPLRNGTAPLFSPAVEVQTFPSIFSALFSLILYTILFLIPAAGNEILYRGFVGTFLEGKAGKVLGGLLSGLYFAFFLGPLQWEWITLNAVLGLLLFFMFQWKKTLWHGIFLLSFFRSALVVFIFGWDYILF